MNYSETTTYYTIVSLLHNLSMSVTFQILESTSFFLKADYDTREIPFSIITWNVELHTNKIKFIIVVC